jgi:hypothetical protein
MEETDVPQQKTPRATSQVRPSRCFGQTLFGDATGDALSAQKFALEHGLQVVR